MKFFVPFYLNSTPSSLTPGLASSFLALKLNPPSSSPPSMLYWFRSTIIGSDFSRETTISSFSWCGSLALCSFLNWRISEMAPVASRASSHEDIRLSPDDGKVLSHQQKRKLFLLPVRPSSSTWRPSFRTSSRYFSSSSR